MKLVDVHCHLDDPQFSADLDQVITRAKDAGVVAIITNAIDLPAYDHLLELAKRYSLIKVALGVYPDNARDQTAHQTNAAIEFIKQHKDAIVAIGEIGIDHKYTTEVAGRERQKEVFIKMLRLAKQLKKPVIIHTRDAEEEALRILIEEKQPEVVLHCFCGTQAQVELAREHGWYFSIPVRAKSSKHFQMIINTMPLNKLLTETDAPYLHYKQERNEPANVKITVETIAKLKGMDPTEVSNVLLQNYLKLFSRK